MDIRIGFVIIGLALIIFSFWNHCIKKLTVDYAVAWSLLGICLILVGVIPIFSKWINSLGTVEKWGFFCIGVIGLFVRMRRSLVNSQLVMKNKELAMQIALLNQENEGVKADLERLTGTQGEIDAEEDLVCY